MKIHSLLLAMAITAPMVCLSQTVLLDDFKTIEAASIHGTYRCFQTRSPSWDVSITYELHPRTDKRSRVDELIVYEDTIGEESVQRINSAIGNRGIEGVAVDCSSSEVRIILSVFDPAKSKLGRVILHKRKDAPLEVGQY